MEKLPAVLYRIVTETINSIAWNSLDCDPTIVFHYRYRKNDYGAWTVVIHPAVHEIIGGKNDGTLVYAKFNISILDISKHFDDIIDMVLSSKESKFFIDGIVGNHMFSLEIMESPPRDSKATKNYHWHTKEVLRKP